MPNYTPIGTDLEAEELSALRKQRVAEMLMGQSMQPVQPFSKAGAYVTPMHWSQGLAQIAQALVAAKKGKSADAELKGIGDKRAAVTRAAVERYNDTRVGGWKTLPGTGVKLDTLADPKGAARDAIADPNAPQSLRASAQMDYGDIVRKEDKETAVAAQQARDAAEAQERADLQAERLRQDQAQHEDNVDLRRDIASMAGAGRPDPAPSMTEVVDPKDPKRMLRVDARLYKGGSLGDPGVLGVSGKEPAAAKADENRGAGKEAADSLIAQLRDNYDQLRTGGGISDTEKNPLASAVDYVQSSGVGQTVGKVFATKNQSARNSIQQTRPLLLQAIKSATGASAQQMNSNVELSLWLNAATDPSMDYQANMDALANLEQVIGSGALPAGPQSGAAQGAGTTPAAAGRKVVRTGMLNGRKVVQYDDGTTEHAD